MPLSRWNVRVVSATPVAAVAREGFRSGVAPENLDPLLARADALAVALEGVEAGAATRLAHEMRVSGGDAAVAKAATGGLVVVGPRAAFDALLARLTDAPADLPAIGREVADALERYARRRFDLRLGPYRLSVGDRPLLMGVVNVTPDSFSDGGKFLQPERAVAHARDLVAEGADLLDVGGESTRPGSDPVPEEEEMRRVLPVVETLAEALEVPISIDTRHARVAREAAAAGAAIVNDITGLQGEREMARAVADTGAGLVLMHIRGEPKTMQDAPRYDHLMAEVLRYLRRGLALAEEAGVPEEATIVDPGIGFGKRLEHNLEILGELSQIRSLGRPILVGPSRKRFLGQVTGAQDPAERVWGTAASCALAVAAGAAILRVHDVAAMRQASAVAHAVARARENAT